MKNSTFNKAWLLVGALAAPSISLAFGPPPPTSVPDGASSLLLVTISAMAMMAGRRFLAKGK